MIVNTVLQTFGQLVCMQECKYFLHALMEKDKHVITEDFTPSGHSAYVRQCSACPDFRMRSSFQALALGLDIGQALAQELAQDLMPPTLMEGPLLVRHLQVFDCPSCFKKCKFHQCFALNLQMSSSLSCASFSSTFLALRHVIGHVCTAQAKSFH